MTDNDNLNANTILGSDGQPDHSKDNSQDLSGRVIREFRLKRKLGQGAMGTVYLAEQESLGRVVAVKILAPKFSRDQVSLGRFEREARAAARLSHPNIVQVFDYGSEDDLYFIATEYVDGGNISSLIQRKGVVEPAEATDLILQACEGLSAAEKQGIVHRDIKPDNLMLTQKTHIIKIADFGLAKLVENRDSGHVTSSGVIVGTPYYMSPEQAKGGNLDYRSDIYSLGVTYYHMLTGQVPFDAESIIGIMLKHISAERPDPLAVNPSLPNAVGEVVRHMIAQLPDDRYQNANEAISDLRHLRDQLRQGVTEIFLRKPAVSTERAKRYKVLRKSQISLFQKRRVEPQVLGNLQKLLKGDSGVFIESQDAFSVDDVVEVRFSIPGNDAPYRAIGLVRWISTDTNCPGIGVTFVKVGRMGRQTASKIPLPEVQKQEAAEVSRYHMMSPEQAMMRITESPLHCRMLRYYYANANQFVSIGTIANALGVGMRLLEPVLHSYEKCGLIQYASEDEVSFIWPDDPAMEEQLVTWISEFGLHG